MHTAVSIPGPLPTLTRSDAFSSIAPLMDARGLKVGGPVTARPAGEELAALVEAVPDFREAIIASGMPMGVATCDIATAPYPTRFAFNGAARTPAPMLWFVNRMLVVQWQDEHDETKTLLWEPTDAELSANTPFYVRFAERAAPGPLGSLAGDRLTARLAPMHGTVMEHLARLGIAAEDVDYLVFDHLHTQDVRRHLGTRNPAPDLGSHAAPIEARFPNARLIVQQREWESLRALHPLQVPWYQPDTYADLPTDKILAVDGDVLVGPGVALMATPGHTAGNQSLVLRTERGLWTSSENGVAAECWTPEASKIAGLRAVASEMGRAVIMNANTLEYAAWQYNSMVVESLVADPTPQGVFRQCFPSSELVRHRLSPGTAPTFSHGHITHGRVGTSTGSPS